LKYYNFYTNPNTKTFLTIYLQSLFQSFPLNRHEMGKTYCFRRKGVECHIFSNENGTIKNDKQKTTQFKEKRESIRKNSATFWRHYNKRFLRFWKLVPSRKMKSVNPGYHLKLMIVFAANSFYSVFEAVKKKIRESKK